MALEQVHHPHEVGDGAGEAVELVDHHAVHEPGLDVGEKPRQRGAVAACAGQVGVVVAPWSQHPSTVALALHVRLGGLALGVQA